MSLKTITPTQIYTLLKRLNEVDITKLDFKKLPTGFQSVEEFDKYISKTLVSAKSDFAIAYKSYTLEQQQAKLNDMLTPWIAKFNGDMDKVYAAVSVQLQSGLAATNVNESEVKPAQEPQAETISSADSADSAVGYNSYQ